jgi:hypothetical protein
MMTSGNVTCLHNDLHEDSKKLASSSVNLEINSSRNNILKRLHMLGLAKEDDLLVADAGDVNTCSTTSSSGSVWRSREEEDALKTAPWYQPGLPR